MFFCLTLTVFNPLGTIASFIASYSAGSQLFDSFPGLRAITVIDALLSSGLMAFSVYAGVSLWRIKPGAVDTAKRYLWCALAYCAVASLLPFMAGLPSEVDGNMIAEVFKNAIRMVAYVAIWSAYLNKSKRVKATFASAQI